MIGKIFGIIGAFFMATWKFVLAIFATLGLNVGLFGSYAITISGGIVGVIVFTYFGAYIAKWMNKKLYNGQSKKIFSKKTRFLVKIRRNFGVIGIAALSPILLSIPLGVFLSLTLTNDKRKIISFMTVSCIFWASVFFLPYYLFDVNLQEFFVK